MISERVDVLFAHAARDLSPPQRKKRHFDCFMLYSVYFRALTLVGFHDSAPRADTVYFAMPS